MKGSFLSLRTSELKINIKFFMVGKKYRSIEHRGSERYFFSVYEKTQFFTSVFFLEDAYKRNEFSFHLLPLTLSKINNFLFFKLSQCYKTFNQFSIFIMSPVCWCVHQNELMVKGHKRKEESGEKI